MSLYIIIQNRRTPLHLAAANNHISVVEKLVNFRAPVNSVEEVTMHIANYLILCRISSSSSSYVCT